MKERPILFSAPMVRALLAGTKTQTRRIVKPQPDFDTARAVIGHHVDDSNAAYDPLFNSIGLREGQAFGFVQPNIGCPYGRPGDRLWVRETWAVHAIFDGRAPRDIDAPVTYAADGPMPDLIGKLRPGIHMPRWLSRITLEITGVRVERLQDISEADASAEGCPLALHLRIVRPDRDDSARGWYRNLWEQINGAGSWDANPWVWALEFRRVDALRLPAAA